MIASQVVTAPAARDKRFKMIDATMRRHRYEPDSLLEVLHTAQELFGFDGDGLLTRADLLIATGQNNLAMNRAIAQIARRFVTDRTITEGAINRVEAGIRAFDPCLSCSTHAVGAMALRLQLLGADGRLLDEAIRP